MVNGFGESSPVAKLFRLVKYSNLPRFLCFRFMIFWSCIAQLHKLQKVKFQTANVAIEAVQRIYTYEQGAIQLLFYLGWMDSHKSS